MLSQSERELELRMAMWKVHRVQVIILLPRAFTMLRIDQSQAIERINLLTDVLDTAKLADGGLVVTYEGKDHARLKTKIVAALKTFL